MPFGEEIDPSVSNRSNAGLHYSSGDSVRQKFTGYQKDEETNLDFAEARMYENRHARFTAVDPLLASGKSANPQTFNRYVYALNNPLSNTDPEGLQVATRPSGAWFQPIDPPSDRIWRAEWIKTGDNVPFGYRPKTYNEHVFKVANTEQWEAQNPLNGNTVQFDNVESALQQLDTWTGGIQGFLGMKQWETALNSEGWASSWGHGVAAAGLKLSSILLAEPKNVQLATIPSGKSTLEGNLISAERAVAKTWTVYLGRNSAGNLYPGMTGRQLLVREAEHIAQGGNKSTLTLAQMSTSETRLGARIAEQILINDLGGKAAMESGKLLNIRNAVAPKFWEMYGIPQPK